MNLIHGTINTNTISCTNTNTLTLMKSISASAAGAVTPQNIMTNTPVWSLTAAFFYDKDNTAIIPASQFYNFASGTYHVVATGISKTGDKAVSKPCELIIK